MEVEVRGRGEREGNVEDKDENLTRNSLKILKTLGLEILGENLNKLARPHYCLTQAVSPIQTLHAINHTMF